MMKQPGMSPLGDVTAAVSNGSNRQDEGNTSSGKLWSNNSQDGQDGENSNPAIGLSSLYNFSSDKMKTSFSSSLKTGKKMASKPPMSLPIPTGSVPTFINSTQDERPAAAQSESESKAKSPKSPLQIQNEITDSSDAEAKQWEEEMRLFREEKVVG